METTQKTISEISTEQDIVIVDDMPDNLRLLVGILTEHGYKVRPAPSGVRALATVRKEPPDLILLDIMMPDMNGYEVCNRLKADELTRDIPIIFLSALNEVFDKVKAFKAGGVDYISKPFQVEEVLARVKTHLNLVASRLKLEQQNIQLKEAACLKEDVEHIIRHDLKGPICNIISISKLLREKKHDAESDDYLQSIEESGYRTLNIIHRSLDLIKMERKTYTIQAEPVDLVKVVGKIIEENKWLATIKDISFEVTFNDRPVESDDCLIIQGEGPLCFVVLSNLTKNAVEASPVGKSISIALANKDVASIRIHNAGIVPKEIRKKFFQKYVTAGKSGGTGLGVYSAALITKTLGGTIKMHTSETQGTVLALSFPLDEEQKTTEFHEEFAKQQDKNTEEKLKKQLVSLPPFKVLIVDDDQNNCTLIETYLTFQNITLQAVNNGRAALQKMSEKHYDLVLMDLEMPLLDGFETVREIRKRKNRELNRVNQTILIALSAHQQAGYREKCFQAGFDDYLEKPLTKSKLFETLLRLIPGSHDPDSDLHVEEAGSSEQAVRRNKENNNIYHLEVDAELKELIPSFIQGKKNDVLDIRNALKENNFKKIHKIGHKIKGTSSMYGIAYMVYLSSKIEKSAYRQNEEDIVFNLNLLSDFLEKVIITYLGLVPDSTDPDV